MNLICIPPQGVAEYDGIGCFVSRASTNTAAWVTLVNINGKGVMHEALLTLQKQDFSYGNWLNIGFRITVDGVIIHSGIIGGASQDWGSVGYTYRVSGFIQKSSVAKQNNHTRGSWDFWMHQVSSYSLLYWKAVSYPYLGNTSTDDTGSINILTLPLVFNTNFKIEIFDTGTLPVVCQYLGGVKR